MNNDIWIFTEIQDHEKVLQGALELISKGRELADKNGGKLYSIVMALEAEKYIDEISKHGPDVILSMSNPALKHYDNEIFPDIIKELIKEHSPSAFLLPSTEAGVDLAARIAQRFETALTSHCTDLDIIDSEEYGKNLLLMKRPAFSGNMVASIICPQKRPQMATVQSGVFERAVSSVKSEIIHLNFKYDNSKLKIKSLKAPIRWDRDHVPLEQADIIIAGGSGVGSQESFNKLFKLSDILKGEVGSTRVPVFNKWCDEERMIGQTGKNIRPGLYIGFGISGQIQHTGSIVDSDVIVSVNSDPNAPINEISDYTIEEDATEFLNLMINKLSTK